MINNIFCTKFSLSTTTQKFLIMNLIDKSITINLENVEIIEVKDCKVTIGMISGEMVEMDFTKEECEEFLQKIERY